MLRQRHDVRVIHPTLHHDVDFDGTKSGPDNPFERTQHPVRSKADSIDAAESLRIKGIQAAGHSAQSRRAKRASPLCGEKRTIGGERHIINARNPTNPSMNRAMSQRKRRHPPVNRIL